MENLSILEVFIGCIVGAVGIPFVFLISHIINYRKLENNSKIFEVRMAPVHQVLLLNILVPIFNILFILFVVLAYRTDKIDEGMLRGILVFLIITIFSDWVLFREAKTWILDEKCITLFRWRKQIAIIKWEDISRIRKTLTRRLKIYDIKNNHTITIPLSVTDESELTNIIEKYSGKKIDF